jgi:hypothetical protein
LLPPRVVSLGQPWEGVWEAWKALRVLGWGRRFGKGVGCSSNRSKIQKYGRWFSSYGWGISILEVETHYVSWAHRCLHTHSLLNLYTNLHLARMVRSWFSCRRTARPVPGTSMELLELRIGSLRVGRCVGGELGFGGQVWGLYVKGFRVQSATLLRAPLGPCPEGFSLSWLGSSFKGTPP